VTRSAWFSTADFYLITTAYSKTWINAEWFREAHRLFVASITTVSSSFPNFRNGKIRHLHREVYGRRQNSASKDLLPGHSSDLFYDAVGTSSYKAPNVKMSDVGESGPISTEWLQLEFALAGLRIVATGMIPNRRYRVWNTNQDPQNVCKDTTALTWPVLSFVIILSLTKLSGLTVWRLTTHIWVLPHR